MFEVEMAGQWYDHEGWDFQIEYGVVARHRTREGAEAKVAKLVKEHVATLKTQYVVPPTNLKNVIRKARRNRITLSVGTNGGKETVELFVIREVELED